MAYNNGFPVTYPQMGYPYYGYQPTAPLPQNQSVQPIQNNGNVAQPSQPQGSTDNGIIWVQGESGAKSYPVAPGRSVMLMDSESLTFYIKSADQSGMPLPLKVYDYTERVQAPHVTAPTVDYVTHDELEKRLAEIIDGKKPGKKESK